MQATYFPFVFALQIHGRVVTMFFSTELRCFVCMLFG